MERLLAPDDMRQDPEKEKLRKTIGRAEKTAIKNTTRLPLRRSREDRAELEAKEGPARQRAAQDEPVMEPRIPAIVHPSVDPVDPPRTELAIFFRSSASKGHSNEADFLILGRTVI